MDLAQMFRLHSYTQLHLMRQFLCKGTGGAMADAGPWGATPFHLGCVYTPEAWPGLYTFLTHPDDEGLDLALWPAVVQDLERLLPTLNGLSYEEDLNLDIIIWGFLERYHDVVRDVVRLLEALQQQPGPDEALDVLLERVDLWLGCQAAPRCDLFLHMANVNLFDSNLLVGMLSATKRAASILPARPAFVCRVRTRLLELAPDRVDQLLANLD